MSRDNSPDPSRHITMNDPHKLSRREISQVLTRWQRAWDDRDLDGVMDLFHDDVLYENWTGSRIRGKAALRRAWAPWFADPAGFRFIEEETFIDEARQKVLYRWRLEWPSPEPGCKGQPECRRGVDILHFRDGRIIQKLTYSKTTINIAGQPIRLQPSTRPEV